MSVGISLEGRVALVTGGASGIGRAAAVRLAEAGARVAVVDLDEAGGRETVERLHQVGGEAALIVGDVSLDRHVQSAVNRVVERFGRLDILFNNAGIIRRRTVLTLSEEDWDRVMAVNVKSIFLMSRAAIPVMQETAGRGSIINTGSGWGVTGGAEAVVYCASKAAVINMTRAMAIDHGPNGIRVNSVSPGDTDTGMLRQEARELGQPWALFESDSKDRPLARLGQPRDIADAVLFLASDLSVWVTGANIVVDGGGLAG